MREKSKTTFSTRPKLHWPVRSGSGDGLPASTPTAVWTRMRLSKMPILRYY